MDVHRDMETFSFPEPRDKRPDQIQNFGAFCGILFFICGAIVAPLYLCRSANKAAVNHTDYKAGSEFKNREIKEIDQLNDVTLNHYLEEYNILRDEYRENVKDIKERIHFSYFGIGKRERFSAETPYVAHKKVFGSKIYYLNEYLRVTGKTLSQAQNINLGDYNKLLVQYERDSIDARYRQLRQQMIITKQRNKYKTK